MRAPDGPAQLKRDHLLQPSTRSKSSVPALGVAQHVDEPFSQLRRRLGDEALLREFARREAEQRKDVEFRRYMHEQDEWLANWGRNTDEIVREMNTSLAELQQALGSDEPGE